MDSSLIGSRGTKRASSMRRIANLKLRDVDVSGGMEYECRRTNFSAAALC